jgi:N-acetyl-gamma-glutamyl-phosphate reductase
MTLKKIRVGIIGHTGRLGKPLTHIIQKHPFAEIAYTESRGEGRQGSLAEAEVVFITLPYGESEKYLSQLRHQKVIDLSVDHRCNTDWTYGLPEIFGNEIKNAKKVANPGCYATSILLGLFPLKGKIKEVNISSVSGISGAGIEISNEDNFLVYQEGRKHPQIGEMQKFLNLENILFVPQRIDTADKGIVSTIFAHAEFSEKLCELYDNAYKACPFVRMVTEIQTKKVIGTNYCDIKVMEFNDGVVIISALDNLIKGGAGQAVQNFNLMCGFEETLALR